MLEGKTIAITGAAQGMGAAMAHVFARHGANVVLGDINEDGAQKVADSVIAEGGQAIAVGIDVSDRGAPTRFTEAAVARFGRLDGLVCAAMRRFYEPAESFDDDHWDIVIDQGLSGYFRFAKAASKVMLEQRSGSIVFITSTASTNAVDGGAAYCAAKAGGAGLARILGVEWAKGGIRTNAIAPGYTETEGALRKLLPEEMDGVVPLGRAAQPEEIAQATAFLLSDLASYITGQELPVDGGFTVAGGYGSGRQRPETAPVAANA